LSSPFPHTEPFRIDDRSFAAAQIIDGLSEYIRPERMEKFRRVIEGRTVTVVPVLEGLYDRGNVSAVFRTAEALGYQMLHLVENQKKFKKANRVTQGADKWLDIVRWKTTTPCIAQLKEHGYRIVATHMEGGRPIDEVDFSQPTAIVLGNEKEGVSEELLNAADERVVIPMSGFTQSFNISVAAALSLYHISRARDAAPTGHADLDATQKECLLASYCLRSVEHAEKLLLRG
jgi:tRNA (guanosine-2'-O-)-methyltransferase